MRITASGQRQKILQKGSFLLAAAIIFAWLFPTTIPAQQDISAYQKRLTKLSHQIRELKLKIKKEEQKETTILSRLDRIGFKKKLIRTEISVYNIQLDKANRELLSIKKRIPTLRTKLEKEKNSIQKILITLYKFGKFKTFQLMLQADNLGSLLAESKNLSLLAQYQENIISEYKTTLSQLKSAESELETKKEEVFNLIQNAHQKRRELETEERRNLALIQEIKRNKNTYLKALQELKERAEELQTLIKKLVKQEISLPFTLIPLYEKKGKLPWPVEGKVVTFFGLQHHPRFNTVIINNGIEIAPRKNKMIIRAIHSGKVVYTDYFQGYGNLIIIDHGMNYYSLYGHCSEFLIEKGEFAKTGQAIALIGDLSSLKGTTLYFEIRFKTKPLNPLHWLKRR